jgi:hypothetical protein
MWTTAPGRQAAVARQRLPTIRIAVPFSRAERPIAMALVLVAALMLGSQLLKLVPRWHEIGFGADRNIVINATDRWLAGGPFYLPEQLSGPYYWTPGVLWVLYPPPTLILFAPFTVLPAILWWIIPIAVITLVVAHHRPRPLALGAIALVLANPTTVSTLVWGNPGMWFAAAVALSTVYSWPAIVLMFKPTLLPFAFVGCRRRSWWVALATAVLLSLPFLPMWRDYILVMVNAHPANSLGYSIPQVPLMLLPIAAWLGGRNAPRTWTSSRASHTA